MKRLIMIFCALAAVIFVAWLGLQVKPKPFAPYAHGISELKTIRLPEALPAPVKRFYRQAYGENIPVITSAVISGRGKLRLFGVLVPMRFRYTHEAGKNFRSDIDITFFGQPIMQALEIYVDGHGYGRTPGGVNQGEAWFNQSANIRMWAEVLNYFPAALLTTPGVSWEPIDDYTAHLIVPSADEPEHLIVRFNPENNDIQFIEAMKYKNANSRMLWINGIWIDEGKPFIYMDVEETLFNSQVSDYIRQKDT